MLKNRRRDESLDDNDAVTTAIQRAVREAIEEQRRAGLSVTIWRDGKKVVVPPEQIPALLTSDDEPAEEQPAADEGDVARPTPANR